MQGMLGKRGFRFANYDVAWRDGVFVASGDEGLTLLRCSLLARLLTVLLEVETHCATYEAVPPWFPTSDNPILDIPADGKIALTETWEYESLRRGDYRIVIIKCPGDEESSRSLMAVVGPSLVRVLHGIDDCRVWADLALTHGIEHADASYRHYLDGNAEIWEWNSYEPRLSKPDRDDPVWEFYEGLDGIHGGRDPETFASSFRYYDYTISFEDGVFHASPDDGMKFEFLSDNLAGVLFGALEMLGPRARSGRTPLWIVGGNEDGERVPDTRIRLPDDAVPGYDWHDDLHGFDGLFRAEAGEHCTYTIWWTDTGREVRAFTRIYHAVEWMQQAVYENAAEADLSYRLALSVGTDNYPAGF